MIETTEEDLSNIAAMVIEMNCKPVTFNGATIEVFASASRAMTGRSRVNTKALCSAADKNTYQVKTAARAALGLAVRG